jgi:hypothetical protein
MRRFHEIHGCLFDSRIIPEVSPSRGIALASLFIQRSIIENKCNFGKAIVASASNSGTVRTTVLIGNIRGILVVTIEISPKVFSRHLESDKMEVIDMNSNDRQATSAEAKTSSNMP